MGNLDRRVSDIMMTNILRTGLPHIADKVLSAKMFSPNDPVSVVSPLGKQYVLYVALVGPCLAQGSFKYDKIFVFVRRIT